MDARQRRVAALYDEVIERVIESLRADVQTDGLEPSVLDELKQVRARRLERAAQLRLTTRSVARAQRWYEKLRDRGTLAGGAAAASGLVSAVGAGTVMMAQQYMVPSAEERAPLLRRPPKRRAPELVGPGQGMASAALTNIAAGVPRGADLYSTVVDGEPDERIVPPVAARLPRLR
jgi:hypothetical protein